MSRDHGTTTGNSIQGPTPVRRHTLRAASGLRIDVLDLGATLDRVEAPAPDGTAVPLTLSLDSVTEREDPVRNPFLGVTVGRYANRIRDSRFTIDEQRFELESNDGTHQLHGGPLGFHHFVWSTDPRDEAVGDAITFCRTSPAGEMGFPGQIEARVTYELLDRTIRITHEATTDAPTVVSLTNHSYWNLGGPAEADIGAHAVQLDADLFVPIDEATLPSGEPVAVAGTLHDLREPTLMSERLGFALPNGYDDCFMINGTGLRRHARVAHTETGRSLEVWSDQPAAQLYTGAYLGGCPGADGRTHDPFTALCVEPQHVTDAPNLTWAPSAVLRPGERYVHQLEFRLDWA